MGWRPSSCRRIIVMWDAEVVLGFHSWIILERHSTVECFKADKGHFTCRDREQSLVLALFN